ncbi:uncharacterized protein LOC144473030 isoform X1 [Augochlora pura]
MRIRYFNLQLLDKVGSYSGDFQIGSLQLFRFYTASFICKSIHSESDPTTFSHKIPIPLYFHATAKAYSRKAPRISTKFQNRQAAREQGLNLVSEDINLRVLHLPEPSQESFFYIQVIRVK